MKGEGISHQNCRCSPVSVVASPQDLPEISDTGNRGSKIMKNMHNGDRASCGCRLTFASLECFSWWVIESVKCMTVLIVNLKYRECI